MSIQKTIAHDLLSIGAVFLRPDDPVAAYRRAMKDFLGQ